MKKFIIILFCFTATAWLCGAILTFSHLNSYDGPEPVATFFTALICMIIAALIAHTIYIIIWAVYKQKNEDWTANVATIKEYYIGIWQHLYRSVLGGIGSLFLFGVILLISFFTATFIIIGLIPFDILQNRPLSYVWNALLGLCVSLSLMVIGIWLVKYLKKTTYANARFWYFIKMLPFLLFVLFTLIFTKGDFSKVLPWTNTFSNTDDTTELGSIGTCENIFGVFRPTSISPAHGSITSRVEQVSISFENTLKRATVIPNNIILMTGDPEKIYHKTNYQLELSDDARTITLTPTSPITAETDGTQIYSIVLYPGLHADFADWHIDKKCWAQFVIGQPDSEEAKQLQSQINTKSNLKKIF
ncbi:MAG: hypothetical protein WC544_02275 [Patescibacteria group bacterium]